MNRAYIAESYRPMQLGSLGNASYMLLSQFDFPSTFEESEQFWSRDSDRLQEHDSDHVAGCLRRFNCGFESFNSTLAAELEGWILRQSPKDLLDFVADLLNATSYANWTGYRIMGTVNDRGHAIYSFQLFARDPNGTTEVYTGEPAPNVLPGRRQR